MGFVTSPLFAANRYGLSLPPPGRLNRRFRRSSLFLTCLLRLLRQVRYLFSTITACFLEASFL